MIDCLKEAAASSAANDDCVPPSSPRSANARAQAPSITGWAGILSAVAASVKLSWYLTISKDIVCASVGIGVKSTFKLPEVSTPLKQ